MIYRVASLLKADIKNTRDINFTEKNVKNVCKEKELAKYFPFKNVAT